MYLWDKQRVSLNTQPGRILRLERSIADVQVTLPGLAPESACAYLVAYHDGKGIRVAIALHLLFSDQLAFYLNDEGSLDSEAAGRVLGEGYQFAESLGFTLGDLDFRRVSKEEQQELWQSLEFILGAPRLRAPSPAPKAETVQAAAPKPQAEKPAKAVTPSRELPCKLPSAKEMIRRRKEFIRNLGRLLGML